MQMDILQHDDLPFPRSLPEFQRFFPDNEVCIKYLQKLRWPDEFFARIVQQLVSLCELLTVPACYDAANAIAKQG